MLMHGREENKIANTKLTSVLQQKYNNGWQEKWDWY